MSLDYVWQKASSALSALSSEGSLIQRLTYAGRELSGLGVQGLPLEVAKALLETLRALSAWPTAPEFETQDGYCAALMRYLPESRLHQLAEKVIYLNQVINEARGAVRAGAREASVPESFDLSSPEKWEFLYWSLPNDTSAAEKGRYTTYARHWLPNFPDEVLLEWQGRHGYESMCRWSHLDLERLVFQDVTWSYDQLTHIKALDPGFLEVGPKSFGAYQVNRKGDWAGEYIRAHGTWCSPIIVIDHPVIDSSVATNIPSGLVLIEGHSRLSRMLNYALVDKSVPLHRVMLARYSD